PTSPVEPGGTCRSRRRRPATRWRAPTRPIGASRTHDDAGPALTMTMRIGINPLTWSNDDLPSLGAGNSLETCLSEAAEAGYSGVELGNKFPRQAAVLAPLLDRHGLRLVSGWYSLRLLERDDR